MNIKTNNKTKFNLLFETSQDIEVLTEQSANGKHLYIEGVFAQSSIRNGNGRIYPDKVMHEAVEKYNSEYVTRNRALGELNHPERPFPDPSEAAIRITEMRIDGNNVYGKALVLNTPKGQIVKGLLEGGFKLGVSTRGLGSVKEQGGVKYVQSPYVMTAVDVVDNPSAPDAYPNAILESTKWMISESGHWYSINEQEQKFNEELFLEKLEQYLRGLK